MQIATKKGMTHDYSAPDQETKVFQLVVAFVETCEGTAVNYLLHS